MAKRDDFGDDAGFFASLLKRKGMEPMPPSMARTLQIIAALIVVAVIVAVAAATWPHKGGVVDENNLPVIHADDSPTHIKPDEPGGMQVPNKDSTIFETINKREAAQNKRVENLLEDHEEPVKKNEVFQPSDTPPVETKEVDKDKLDDTGGSEQIIIEEKAPRPDTKTDAVNLPDENAGPVVPSEKASTAKDKNKKPETAVPPVAVKPEPKKVEAALKPEKEIKKQDIISQLKSEVGSGNTFIQLASVKSEADAKTKWAKLQAQFPSLKSLSPRFAKADLGAKGVFYRVQAGPMSMDVAKSTCTAIKSAKGDCLVAK